MRITKTFGILLLGVFVATAAIAQTEIQRPLTKKEKKEWRKKKKKMSEEDFRNMYDQNTAQKASITSMQSEISSLEGQVTERDDQISDLKKTGNSYASSLPSSPKRVRKYQKSTSVTACLQSKCGQW